MVNQSIWMDVVSKNMSIEKVSLVMIIFKIKDIYILIQAQSMIEKVGYPDYLKGNNMTRLDNHYAAVC
jgi:hypothetical protein